MTSKDLGHCLESQHTALKIRLDKQKCCLGVMPLAQIAKRLIEIERAELETIANKRKEEFPKLRNNIIAGTFEIIEFDGFILRNTTRDQWFLTKGNEVVKMINVVLEQNEIFVYGAKIANLKVFLLLHSIQNI